MFNMYEKKHIAEIVIFCNHFRYILYLMLNLTERLVSIVNLLHLQTFQSLKATWWNPNSIFRSHKILENITFLVIFFLLENFGWTWLNLAKHLNLLWIFGQKICWNLSSKFKFVGRFILCLTNFHYEFWMEILV